MYVPSLKELPKFPVVGGVGLAAVTISIVSLQNIANVSALYCDPHTSAGEPWRLVTSALPHGNGIHIFFNVYWLWVMGTLVERIFGHLMTFGLFVLFAAGSSAAEYAVLDGGIGLSGVVYGIFGLLWMLSRYHPAYRGLIDKNTSSLFIIWFFACIVLTYLNMMPVANLAHAAGALLGILVGCAFARPHWRWPALAGTAVVAGGFIAAALFFRPFVNLSPRRGLPEDSLAIQAIEAGDLMQAEKWSRRAAQLNPKDGRLRYNLGVVLERQGKSDEAKKLFEQASKMLPPELKAETNPAIEQPAANGDRSD